MARVKNVGGGPGDEDLRPPPHLSTEAKGKVKKLTAKKRKFLDADTERAATVIAIVERAERGGAQSGFRIADQLSPTKRATIERVESLHGSPAGTAMIGG